MIFSDPYSEPAIWFGSDWIRPDSDPVPDPDPQHCSNRFLYLSLEYELIGPYVNFLIHCQVESVQRAAAYVFPLQLSRETGEFSALATASLLLTTLPPFKSPFCLKVESQERAGFEGKSSDLALYGH
jgi:hypothetical protein